MAPKKGQRLGGIYELEDLRIRCRIDAECGCWRWGLRLNDSGAAEASVMVDGKKRDITGRRASLILSGPAPKPGQEAIPRAICQHMDCVNPGHSRWGSRRERQVALAARGRWSKPLDYARLVETSRARRKLDDDQRLEIASSTERLSVLAQRYGVSESLVSGIRRGVSRRGAPTSVFGWRP